MSVHLGAAVVTGHNRQAQVTPRDEWSHVQPGSDSDGLRKTRAGLDVSTFGSGHLAGHAQSMRLEASLRVSARKLQGPCSGRRRELQPACSELRFAERGHTERLFAQDVRRVAFAHRLLECSERLLNISTDEIGESEIHPNPRQDGAQLGRAARVARLLEPGNRGLGVPSRDIRRSEAPVAHGINERRVLVPCDVAATQAGDDCFGKAPELGERHPVEAFTDEPKGADGVAASVAVALQYADAAHHELRCPRVLTPEVVKLSKMASSDTEQGVVVPRDSDLAGPLGQLNAALRIAEHE